MKIKEAESGKKGKRIVDILMKAMNWVTIIYTFMMLVVFPLYIRNGYSKIGTSKYQFFRVISMICFGVLILLGVCYLFATIKEGTLVKRCRSYSLLDILVLLYGVCVIVSFAFSEYKDVALFGTKGWYMGMYSQLIFVLTYFFLSRFWEKGKWILYLHFFVSGMVFLIGILNRFMIDPLGVYRDLPKEYIIQFLSTFGQATWYSSYICTVFPIGIFLFVAGRSGVLRFWSGIYCAIGFAAVVTQNSDSAFISVAAILLVLFWFAFEDNRNMKQMLELLLIMFASFALIGILQNAFSERAVLLEQLSMTLSKGIITKVALAVCLVLYVVFVCLIRQRDFDVRKFSVIRKIVLVVVATIVLLVVLLIYLNTTGALQAWFGFRSNHNYLLFDKNWGNGRGFTWSFSIDVIREMPILKKLVGVGPDCFASYCYSIPEYVRRLDAKWGENLTLTNAHNEFLNTMICLGLFGLLSYASMLVAAVKRFLAERKTNILCAAMGLGVLSYMAHNLFCYQQACGTPILFIVMGIGEAILRKEKDKNKTAS